MKLFSRPFWLLEPIDVQIVPEQTDDAIGPCRIIAADFYEDSGEENCEEIAYFDTFLEAKCWLENNNFAPMTPGRMDGIYRNLDAVEWFNTHTLIQIPKPKPAKPKIEISPAVQRRIIELMGA
jgi:hypothetical protein